MEVLRLVRDVDGFDRGVWLRLGRLRVAALLMVSALMGCEAPTSDVDLRPDAQLVSELGLTLTDRVHSVALSTGATERSDPDSVVIEPGDYLQFVSRDWFVHEVRFDTLGLDPEVRRFLESTAQIASPPLLQQGARWVLSFVDAPGGSYPYRLEGNRSDGEGVIVVAPPSGNP